MYVIIYTQSMLSTICPCSFRCRGNLVIFPRNCYIILRVRGRCVNYFVSGEVVCIVVLSSDKETKIYIYTNVRLPSSLYTD